MAFVPGRGGGGEVLGLIFAGYVPLPANYRPQPGATFGQICNFRDPNLFIFYFNELIHFLDWMKNTLPFICSTNILVRLLTVNMKNYLTPKKHENVRPHSSNSIENATPL